MLVFACPEVNGIYQGFEYDAIAVAYDNSDIVKVLDISAFQGNAGGYVVHSDGRVVIDHAPESWKTAYNFIAVLRDHSGLSEDEIMAFSEELKQGHTGAMLVNLEGRNYYLIYEKVNIQDWELLGIVPADIVNASMNELQFSTLIIVGALLFSIAAFIIVMILRKNRLNIKSKNTQILYRDEMFKKLSMNVDDVFLMVDAKTARVDYVSPNIEKLLGITVKQIEDNSYVLGKLHPQDTEGQRSKHLKGLLVNEQREWDFEYVHKKTGKHRWFHIIAMGSEVEKKRKCIIVMSDRTADKKMNQALSDAVCAAETANRAKSTFLSNMSHDIRTPMNAIIGFTTLAVSNIENQEKVRDYLGKILASSNHLLSLT